jgi:hypothetical protein
MLTSHIFTLPPPQQPVRYVKLFFMSYFQKPDGRLSGVRRRHPDSWKKKVHPVFIEIAAMYRSLAEAQHHPRREKRKEGVHKVLVLAAQKRDKLLESRPDISPGTACYDVVDIGYLPPSPQEKVERVFDWFFFKRHRTPRWLAIEREKAGDRDAHNQLVRARDEFWLLINGHGPVPPFKVDLIHSDLLELGLHHGLTKLTPEELADCFEEVCMCGKVHSADALKKQRGRVVKDVKAASYQTLMYRLQKPAWERFAVYGADGFIAKPYHPRDGQRYVEITKKRTGLEYVIYQKGNISGFRKESRLSRLKVFSRLPAGILRPEPRRNLQHVLS